MAMEKSSSVVLMLSCLFLFVAASDSAMAGSGDVALSSIEDILPATLAVPEGNELQAVLFATGVQIYVYNGTAWLLNNVSADLYNFKGLKVGFHYFLAQKDANGGQPTWETFHPVSSVTAKRVAAVSQTDSIDWLLLNATSNSGTKFLGVTRYVQRLFTQHGLPPAASFPAQASDVYESNYTALYAYSTNTTSVKNSRRSTNAVFNILEATI